MAVRTMDQAERDLGEHFDDFRSAVSVANAHLWRTCADDMHRTSGRSRANVLCDWIGDEVSKIMDGKPGVVVTSSYGVSSIALGQEWLLRVHKMNEDGAVATNNTQLRLALEENDLAQGSLFGVPPSATLVYLGYVENVANPLEPEVWLTCPDGEKPAWEILLGRAAPRPVVELPPAPTPPDSSDETRIVPKRQEEEERETE